MATSTTTASAIRAQQVSDIEALTPSSFDGVPFREHREQEEFDAWLEANTASCFRRFQVVDQIDYELSDRSGADIEVILARFTLSVAYPKDGRYGFTNEADVTAVLEEDHLAIDKAIGILGAENHVAGQQSCVIDSVELEDNGSHWLVVYELTVQFNLSTGYAGGAFSHAGAGTTTASAIKAAQAGLIHALTPSTHSGVPFQEHRRGGVFEQWAAQADRGAFRRFHINPGYSYTSPLYTNFSAEQVQTTFEVQVAYPRDRRFGTGTEYDARQVIAEDAVAIIVAIGSIGTGSYAAGHHGTVFESSTLDENGDGWMLRLEFEVSFSKAPVFSYETVAGPCTYTPVDPGARFTLLQAGDESTLAAAMGLGAQTPDHYVILDDSDGGVDIVGAGDLTVAQSTPLFQVANTTLGAAFAHMNSALDAVDCVNNTDWDVGNESMTLLWIGTLDSAPGNNKYLCSKGTTSAGYCLRTKSTGAIEWTTFHTSGSTVETISYDHYVAQTRGDLVAILATSDQNANLGQAWSNLGASESGPAQANNLSDTGNPFSCGAGIGSTHAHKPALVALWKGANGEGIREANLAQLLDYLGLGIYHDVL